MWVYILSLLFVLVLEKKMDEIATGEDYETYDVIDIRREECYKLIRDHNQSEGNLRN